MHYDLGGGIIIKSENAAKPSSQRSTYLTKLLGGLPPVDSCFDYGCGKLRYHQPILSKTDRLTLVDSEIQLSRQQVICGVETSIRDYVNGSNTIDLADEQAFAKSGRRYDRGFCINVLSVIPILARRRSVLKSILEHLAPNGRCLFVVQYRNSDFSRMAAMRNAQPWRDGYLINSLRGYSFYGLIRPEKLTRLVERAGFVVDEISLNDGSAYVWATPQKSSRKAKRAANAA